jgi:hypothetical protein
METLAKLVDESLARHGINVIEVRRDSVLSALQPSMSEAAESASEFANKTENQELGTQSWAAAQAEVA